MKVKRLKILLTCFVLLAIFLNMTGCGDNKGNSISDSKEEKVENKQKEKDITDNEENIAQEKGKEEQNLKWVKQEFKGIFYDLPMDFWEYPQDEEQAVCYYPYDEGIIKLIYTDWYTFSDFKDQFVVDSFFNSEYLWFGKYKEYFGGNYEIYNNYDFVMNDVNAIEFEVSGKIYESGKAVNVKKIIISEAQDGILVFLCGVNAGKDEMVIMDIFEKMISSLNLSNVPPDIIYTTTAEENGYRNNYMSVSGEIIEIMDEEDSPGAFIKTSKGDLLLYKREGCSNVEEFSELKVGDIGTFSFMYEGLSLAYNIPAGDFVHILSLNNDIKQIEENGIISEEKKSEISKFITETVAQNYRKTAFEKYEINENLETEKEGDYVLLIYLKWSEQNSAETSKKMIEMYATDLIVKIGEEFDYITEVCTFWDVPYLNGSGKVSGYKEDGKMMYGDIMYDF
ncbi:MAG: hypothetical protein IJF98_03450 [Firmicutes bacterium]|nr:hypothetical protein [Bacillota bacterium]